MQFGLDLATTFIINVFVHLMMTLLLGLFWHSAARRGDAGLGWWVFNEAMMTAVLLLPLARAVVPDGLLLALSNAVLLAFMPVLEHGLRRWFGRSLWPGMAWRWGVAALAYAAWVLLWCLGRDFATRAVWFAGASVLQSLLLGQCVLGQLRGAERGSRQGLLLIGLVTVLSAVMNLWRAQQTWPYMGASAPAPTYPLTVLMMVNILAAVICVSAMLLMLHDRAEARLRQASVELEQRANVDSLTQVYNRAHFESASGVLLTQARASRLPVCLLACDMDGFKTINDELGHPEGDALLVRFAAQLRAALRQGDLAGRLGGDEFAVLLFNCPLDTARRIGERLRERVASELQALDGRRVTLSAGLALARPGEDFEGLYRRADLALYAAKAAGRNRLVAEA